MSRAQEIIECCERQWDAHKSDCSGFVRAVAGELGYSLTGNADAITAILRAAANQTHDGTLAAQWAAEGRFVIAGLEGHNHVPSRAHGHVVVVVDGQLAHEKYPTAYWGMLGGVGKKAATLNWAWNNTDRDAVVYAAVQNDSNNS